MTSKTIQATANARPARKGKPVALKGGTRAVWAAGVEERYGISAPTRWRWERKGWLPPRDVHVGRKSGWKPETLDEAEQKPI